MWKKLTMETLKMNHDEHVYKVIHICYEMWKLKPNENVSGLYFTAARMVKDNKFSLMNDDFTLEQIEYSYM